MPLWELEQNVSNSRQGKLRKINKWDFAYCSLISTCQILWTFMDLYSVQRNFNCLISFNLCETSGRFLRVASVCGRWWGTWGCWPSGSVTSGWALQASSSTCFPSLTRLTQRTRRSIAVQLRPPVFNAFGVHLSLGDCGHGILKESASQWLSLAVGLQPSTSTPGRTSQMGKLCSITPPWAGRELASSALAWQLAPTNPASFHLPIHRCYPSLTFCVSSFIWASVSTGCLPGTTMIRQYGWGLEPRLGTW